MLTKTELYAKYLEYVFLIWGNAQTWRGLFANKYYYSLEDNKLVVRAYHFVDVLCKICAVPRGGNLTYNGDPRVGKLTFENLKMSHFSWVATTPTPILVQTIDRYIRHDIF